MASVGESDRSNRARELDHIIGELEALNEQARQSGLWIRTKWNTPNQRPWHLGCSEPPVQAPHNLPAEYPPALPFVWKWGQIEPYLMKLTELCPLELTERQSVLLINPAFGMKGVKVTNTLRVAISICKRGDEAKSHLHTPSASRTLLSESGGYTLVEGERIEPKRGDLVFTPSGTWHQHGNDDDQPVIWADILDLPLLDFLGASWVRDDHENAPIEKDQSVGFSDRFYSRGGIRPRFEGYSRGEGRKVTPMFHHKGTDIRTTLDDLRGFDGDPFEGIVVELVNPHTGAPAFPTISHRAQLLRAGEETLPYRHTASTLFCVMEGAGYTEVDGDILEWQKNDFFVVPNHRWRRLKNTGKEDAVLYSYTDEPLISKIGLYRAQGRTKSGELVELA